MLDAAEHVFANSGYHGTLIADIVGHASVGQGTFYRHFDSKRAIFDALFDRLFESILAEFDPNTVKLPTNIDEYRALSTLGVAHAIDIMTQHSNAVLMFLREGPSVDRAVQQRIEEMHDRIAVLAEYFLRHAIDRGFARPCDASLVSQAIVGQAIRIVTLWLDHKLGDRTAEQVTNELVDFSVMGYGPAS